MRSIGRMAVPTVSLLVLASSPLPAAQPLAVSPGEATAFAPVHTACPTFSWSAVDGATGYELIVYEVPEVAFEGTFAVPDSPEASPALRQSIPAGALSWTPAATSCLEIFGRYAWTVRALGANKSDSWSESRMFQVDPDPIVRRISGVLESALGQYFDAREIPMGSPGELAVLITNELQNAASEPKGPSPPSEKTVFLMGNEVTVSEMNTHSAQLEMAQSTPGPLDPPGTAYSGSAHAIFGEAGGTSGAVVSDDAELVIDDEFDSAAAGGILVFRSENTFDWAWRATSAEAGGALVLSGPVTGDSVTFPAAGGARFNDAFVLNEFILDPKSSGSRPICSSASDEGMLYYDTIDGLCYCDGASWKQVDGGAPC